MKNETVQFNEMMPILKNSDVKFAGIFGSYARGEERPRSDIDLLIRFKKPKTLLDIVHLENALRKKMKKKIDIVTEQSLSPYLKNAVMRDLKVVYGKR